MELANDINDHMPDYVVRRIIEGLNRLGRPVLESRVLLLGLAYKKNSSDARESPAQGGSPPARLAWGPGERR